MIRADTSRRSLLAAVTHRRRDIAQEVFARIGAIGDDGRTTDPIYAEGLRRAVEAAIDHTIEASARDRERPLPMPDGVLAQARLAARKGTPLETVLRRYFAGHTIVGDVLIEEAGRLQIAPSEIRHALRSAAAETDRMVAAISSAYSSQLKEAEARPTHRRRAELVRRLLAGELIESEDFDYDLRNFHVATVGHGSNFDQAIRKLAVRLGAVSLLVEGDDGLQWAWIGRRDRLDSGQISIELAGALGRDLRIGVGEPAQGRAGWRLSHNQARAALSVAGRTRKEVVRYADVALLASAIKDEVLTTSLRALYLEPLEDERGDGETLRHTLRAYFAAGRSTSSAAAALGVTRNTVTNRIRATEERIGHLRPSLAAHLELALSLDDCEAADRQT